MPTNDRKDMIQQGFDTVAAGSDVLGDDGVWFNTEVLIAVGEK